MFLPEKPARVGLVDRALEHVLHVEELAADVDVGDLRADGVAGNRAPLDAAGAGCAPSSRWSLNVPGSLSSALQAMYFGFGDFLSTNCHFMPVGNPAPPRPRKPGRLDDLDRPDRASCASAFFSPS